MRLIEFADPKPYTVSVDDARDFLNHPETIWPMNDVAFIPGTKRLQKTMCNSGADRITQPSHRRRSSVLRLQPRTPVPATATFRSQASSR